MRWLDSKVWWCSYIWLYIIITMYLVSIKLVRRLGYIVLKELSGLIYVFRWLIIGIIILMNRCHYLFYLVMLNWDIISRKGHTFLLCAMWSSYHISSTCRSSILHIFHRFSSLYIITICSNKYIITINNLIKSFLIQHFIKFFLLRRIDIDATIFRFIICVHVFILS